MRSKHLLRFSALLLLCALVGCDTTFQAADEIYVANAKKYLAQDDYSSAEIELKNALQRNPENREARWMLGVMHVAEGDGAAAQKELEKAGRLGVVDDSILPDLAEALRLQGKHDELLAIDASRVKDKMARAKFLAFQALSALDSGDIERAGELFDMSANLDKSNPLLLTGKAIAKAREREYEQSRELLTAALELDPSYYMAWRTLGDVEKIHSNFDAAESAFTNAIKNRRNNRYELAQRAEVRVRLGKYDQAAEDIARAMKRFPRYQGHYYALGLLSLVTKKFDDAINAFQPLADDGNLGALFYLGVAFIQTKQYEQAEAAFRRLVARQPAYIPSRKYLALLLLHKKRYREVTELLRPIVAQNSKDLGSAQYLAYALSQQGEYEHAKAILTNYLKENPDAVEVKAQLGSTMMAAGEVDQGLGEIEDIVRGEASFEAAESAYVLSLLSKRDPVAAKSAVAQLLEKRPESVTLMNLKGIIEMETDDLAASRNTFERSLQLEPNNLIALQNLSTIAAREREFDKARSHLAQALAAVPEDRVSLRKMAELEIADGRSDKAEELLDGLARRYPDDMAGLALLAQIYLKSGRVPNARTLLNNIDASGVIDRSTLHLLVRAYLTIGEPEKADFFLRRLITIAPDDAETYYLNAQLFAQRMDEGMVKESLDKALDLDPMHKQSLMAFAHLYLDSGDLEKAETYFQRVPKSERTGVSVLRFEGKLAEKNGQPDQGLRLYADALKLSPTQDVLIEYVNMLSRHSLHEKALSTIEEWRQRNQRDDARLGIVIAALYDEMGKEEQATNAYESVLEQEPNNLLVLNNLAWRLRLYNPDKALAYAEMAYSLAPGNAVVSDTLGVLMNLKGEHDKAESLIRDALSRSPNSPDYRFHLAQVFVDRGDLNDGVKMLEELLSDGHEFKERSAATELLNSITMK